MLIKKSKVYILAFLKSLNSEIKNIEAIIKGKDVFGTQFCVPLYRLLLYSFELLSLISGYFLLTYSKTGPVPIVTLNLYPFFILKIGEIWRSSWIVIPEASSNIGSSVKVSSATVH